MTSKLNNLLSVIDKELGTGKHALNTSTFLRDEIIEACNGVSDEDVKDVATESIVRAIDTLNKMLNTVENT